MDPEELAMYKGTCPTTLNYISNYRDGIEPYAYTLAAPLDADDDRYAAYKLSADGTEVQRIGPPSLNATRDQAFP
jgi:hypothetical protein